MFTENSDRLGLGVQQLTVQIKGGLERGSVNLFIGHPATHLDALIYTVAAQRPTVFIDPSVTQAKIEQGVEFFASDDQEPELEYLDELPDGLITKHCPYDAPVNIVIDAVDVFEKEYSTEEYGDWLQTVRNVVGDESVVLLRGYAPRKGALSETEDESMNRQVTIAEADAVFNVVREFNTNNRQSDRLHISKLPYGQTPRQDQKKVQLVIENEMLEIDTSDRVGA